MSPELVCVLLQSGVCLSVKCSSVRCMCQPVELDMHLQPDACFLPRYVVAVAATVHSLMIAADWSMLCDLHGTTNDGRWSL